MASSGDRIELRQDLEDRGVKVEMVVYKGFGHGITKPKSMRAVMQHNLSWFNHFIWGDPLPDFTALELPKKEAKDEKVTIRVIPFDALEDGGFTSCVVCGRPKAETAVFAKAY